MTWFIAFALAASYGMFLANGLNYPQLQLWDESRLAVTAMEMSHTGLSLVTTYDFQPDWWSTKPPLLIWMMTLSMKWLGPSLWAIRLPNVLAASATIAVVYLYVKKVSSSQYTAILASLLLGFSHGFFGTHAALTADYDVMLTFFTTSYLLCVFFLVHQRTPSWRLCALCGLLVICAVLTKGIAGVVPGAGVVAYLIVTKRLVRTLSSARHWMIVITVAAAAAAFYAGREFVSPGFLQAVLSNELGDRFNETKEGHAEPPWYYFKELATRFSLGSWTARIPFSARSDKVAGEAATCSDLYSGRALRDFDCAEHVGDQVGLVRNTNISVVFDCDRIGAPRSFQAYSRPPVSIQCRLSSCPTGGPDCRRRCHRLRSIRARDQEALVFARVGR
jgi:4-amino-4-deoxy-L-arabinose transferase-like glycosyltransferase